MLIIGSHTTFAGKQLLGCVEEALGYEANAIMLYTGQPDNSIRRKIDLELTKQAHELMQKNNISKDNVICHAPYIINLANNSDARKYDFCIKFIKQEIERCEQLGISKLVIHPGSSVKFTKEEGIKNIIDGLNAIFTKKTNVVILLETMAGKGSERGSTLEEIKTIIDGVKNQENIGVCIDTCHLNDAGYDMAEFDKFLDEFDSLIGLDKIKCIHINDSKNDKNSHKDRHANIGYGTLGFSTILNIVYNEKLKDVPKILETPAHENCVTYKHEIIMLKNKVFDESLYETTIATYK